MALASRMIQHSSRLLKKADVRCFSVHLSDKTVEIPNQSLTEFTLETMSKVKNQDKACIIEGVSGRQVSYREFPFRVGAAIKGLKDKGVKVSILLRCNICDDAILVNITA